MREAITKLDLNFSNAGGGHTASLVTIAEGKSLDGGDGLGTVIGEAGEINNFSNAKIDAAMNRFICIQKTKNSGPTKTSIARKYVDRTSLMLESIIVLVRGVNCGPEGGPRSGEEVELSVPYFTEVINSPLESYKSMGPKRSGSIIEAGRIYNQESAATYSGVKIELIYHNKKLIKELSLNLDYVSEAYEQDPDLAQYSLKYGYTLEDFKEMVRLAGVSVIGLPSGTLEDKLKGVLFENTGTLSSVISSVASYLGYFWYIDPDTGNIQFINTEQASNLTVEDHTNTTNSDIISASFTENHVTNKIVNVFRGNTEKKEKSEPTDIESRPRPAFFKKVDTRKFDGFNKLFSRRELGYFYAVFNQSQSEEVFDMWVYLLMWCWKKNWLPRAERQGVAGGGFGAKPKPDTVFDISNLFNHYLTDPTKYWFAKLGVNVYDPNKPNKSEVSMFGGGDGWDGLSDHLQGLAQQTKLRLFPNRAAQGARGYWYFNLQTQIVKDENGKEISLRMPRPSSTRLYSALKGFFEMGGGLFISNGYSAYKAERMEFTNTNNITVVGPYKGNTILQEIDELAPLTDVLDILDVPAVSLKKVAQQFTGGRAKFAIGKESYFFVALRTYPRVARSNIKGGGNIGKNVPPEFDIAPVDFQKFSQSYEIVEGWFPDSKNAFVGGPATRMKKNKLLNLYHQSEENFKKATTDSQKGGGQKSSLSLKYNRSKTRVNKLSEDGEEAEDDENAEKSADNQKLAELFDRFDMKYWAIEAPNYNIFNKLSLASASGSTPEMLVLRDVKGRYRDSPYKPSSASRTLYGLHIPDFTPTLNGISISVGSNGITTTLTESTIKLIPPDQQILMSEGMEAVVQKSFLPKSFSASQRNLLGL